MIHGAASWENKLVHNFNKHGLQEYDGGSKPTHNLYSKSDFGLMKIHESYNLKIVENCCNVGMIQRL